VARFFEPYTGKSYFKNPVFGRRLLLIGESHYNDSDAPCESGATREVVDSFLSGQAIPFFDYLAEAAQGNRWAMTKDEFWHSVAFANFVQRPMESVSHRPTHSDFEAGAPAFWDTLARLAPDIVFMFTSAWNVLPEVAPGGMPEGTGGVGGPKSWLWRYAFAERAIYVARFNHPSARSNPSRAVWKAWADHCWHVLETSDA